MHDYPATVVSNGNFIAPRHTCNFIVPPHTFCMVPYKFHGQLKQLSESNFIQQQLSVKNQWYKCAPIKFVHLCTHSCAMMDVLVHVCFCCLCCFQPLLCAVSGQANITYTFSARGRSCFGISSNQLNRKRMWYHRRELMTTIVCYFPSFDHAGIRKNFRR